MNNFSVVLFILLVVFGLEKHYDNFLLWIYGNEGVLPFLVRVLLLVALLNLFGLFSNEKKAQKAKGDNVA